MSPGGGGGGGGGGLVDCGELELYEHHVISQPHGEVERGRPGQEVIHLEQK